MLVATESSTRKWIFRVLLGAMLIATGLTRAHSIDKSLWGDEAWVANAILEPTLSDSIYYRGWLQTCPPLFLVLHRVVIAIFGVSNEAFRLVSVVLGIASIVPMIFIARRLLEPLFSLVAIFLFVFCADLVPYTHELKQYSSDVFVSLVLVNVGLKYLDSLSRSRLYLWLGLCSVFAFLSYQALVFVPGILLVTLGHVARGDAPRNGKPFPSTIWRDVVAIVLCALILAVVNYFIFIRPNKQPILDIFWHSDFFHGNGLWELLGFYTGRFLDLAALLFFSQVYSRQYLLEILICSILAIGVGALYVRGLMGARQKFDLGVFLSMPIISIILLNVVGLYPLGTTRLTLFLVPIVIVLFVYGLQSLSDGVSTIFKTVSHRKVIDAFGTMSLILLVLLLWSYISRKGASPLFRSLPEEDSGLAVRYLSERVRAEDVVYVHASMREPFRVYSRLAPVSSTKIVWGNIGWPCCPRDISVNQLGEGEDVLPAELARLGLGGRHGFMWLLFTDRPGYWQRSGRRGPVVFGQWLKGAGCMHSERISLRGVRIEKYYCSGAGIKVVQSSLAKTRGNRVVVFQDLYL